MLTKKKERESVPVRGSLKAFLWSPTLTLAEEAREERTSTASPFTWCDIPEQADCLIIQQSPTWGLLPSLLETYERLLEPKAVILIDSNQEAEWACATGRVDVESFLPVSLRCSSLASLPIASLKLKQAKANAKKGTTVEVLNSLVPFHQTYQHTHASHLHLQLAGLHRYVEKTAENLPLTELPLLLSRWCPELAPYSSRILVEMMEEMSLLTLPERAAFQRVIWQELHRIQHYASVLASFATLLRDLFASDGFRRVAEFAQKIAAELTGEAHLFLLPGGCRYDFSAHHLTALKNFIAVVRPQAVALRKHLRTDHDWVRRTRSLGSLSKESMMMHGVTGPNLRASGVLHDERWSDPLYRRLGISPRGFVGTDGDACDRCLQRMNELLESLQFIETCLNDLPYGAFQQPSPSLSEMDGELARSIETPRGRLTVFGSWKNGKTQRLRICPPSFPSSSILDTLLRGNHAEDIPLTVASFDLSAGEAAR